MGMERTKDHGGNSGKVGCSKLKNKRGDVTKGSNGSATKKSSTLKDREEGDTVKFESDSSSIQLTSPVIDNNRSTGSGLTVPSPFSLETEKRAHNGSKSAWVQSTSANADRAPTDSLSGISPNGPKKTQSASPSMPKKSLLPELAMSPNNEDACSVASTATSVRSSKAKSHLPSAPVFRCPERVEKRKEFYAKLEEKHQAVEAERIQNEAKAKEAEEAYLMELRKSMTFKANPVPSFYYEGPPLKVELKKIPPTRAKSPKFSRRKSSDAAIPVTSHSEERTDRAKAHHRLDRQRSSGCQCENEKPQENGKVISKD